MVAERRSIALAVLATLASLTAASAAELPSQYKKSKAQATAKHCNVAGSPGLMAANGVCVRLSGYVSTEFNAGRVK